MDLEKLLGLASKFGFPGIVSVWLMWKVQAFMDAMIVNQTATTELLRQLVTLHQR
jgi:hypothetical protein